MKSNMTNYNLNKYVWPKVELKKLAENTNKSILTNSLYTNLYIKVKNGKSTVK